MSLFELLVESDRFFSPSSLEYKKVSAANAKLRVDTVSAVSALAQENDRLRLYCAALARLLLKKGVLELDEISKMLDEIDPEDGFIDGKLKGRPLPGELPRAGIRSARSAPQNATPAPKKRATASAKQPARPLAKPPKGWKPKATPKKD
jgi:hypothetical protein